MTQQPAIPRVPSHFYTLRWQHDSQDWLTITPQLSLKDAVERLNKDPAALWQVPPREVRFGDALPNDVQVCIGGHCVRLGWLREILKQA